jgi:hypothetical protein
MKKGSKVWYYKDSASKNRPSGAGEGTLTGFKNGNALVAVKRQVGRGVTGDFYLTFRSYAVFSSKEELDAAVVNGVTVWIANCKDRTVNEARYDVVTDGVSLLTGERVYRYGSNSSEAPFLTQKECVEHIRGCVKKDILGATTKRKEMQKNLSDSEKQIKRLTAELARADAFLNGKGRNPFTSTPAKADDSDD